MIISITGGSGFIGRNFYELLETKNDTSKIKILDIVRPAFKLRAGDQFLEGDIRNRDDVSKLVINSDVLIHLAAAHRDSGVPYDEYFDVNVKGTKKLLDACTDNKVDKIIFTSSVAVYGKEYANDETVPEPKLPYGQSKLEAEKIIQAWVAEKPTRKVLIIRPTVVIGKYNVANMYNLIKVVHDGKLRFYINGGNKIKSLASVDELVGFIYFSLRSLDTMIEKIETINFVSYPQLKTKETINAICKTLGRSQPRFSLPLLPLVLVGKLFDLFNMVGIKTPISSARISKLDTQTLYEAKRKQDLYKINKLDLNKYTPINAINDQVEWYKKQLL